MALTSMTGIVWSMIGTWLSAPVPVTPPVSYIFAARRRRHLVPLRRVIGVEVEPADVAVQDDEVVERYIPVAQGLEPVLDAGVLERTVGKAGIGIRPIDVAPAVLQVAADPVRVG